MTSLEIAELTGKQHKNVEPACGTGDWYLFHLVMAMPLIKDY